jgi:serine protease Do
MRQSQGWSVGRWGRLARQIPLLAWAGLVLSGAAVVAAQPGASGTPAGWTTVAKAAMPAVVNIASARTVGAPEQGPYSSDPFFRFFFGAPETVPRRERSLGSGVIVTPDGYVLTNNHVVEGAQDIRVTLADRRELRAQLVGSDPRTDLAVLRLPGRGFPTIPLGDASRVEVAEVVLAIGNPFGLGQTVTMGIVSAVGRANVGIADYEDFIQTDAAINPGNSGGALVNTRGELIGINTAIVSQSGGSMGIGFAVPVNMAGSVMDQLIKRGRVTRGYLGVTVQEVTPALGRGLGLPATGGALVSDLVPDGPAARGGLQRGDLITAIDGQHVTDVGHFRNLVAGTAPGTRVRLTLLRGTRELAVGVTVDALPEPRPAPAPAARRSDPLGVSVADLTADVARKLGLPATARGAVVSDVQEGGLAAEAGLRPGDVILEVNRRPVRSAREFGHAVAQAGGGDLVLLVNRRGHTAYLVLERGG